MHVHVQHKIHRLRMAYTTSTTYVECLLPTNALTCKSTGISFGGLMGILTFASKLPSFGWLQATQHIWFAITVWAWEIITSLCTLATRNHNCVFRLANLAGGIGTRIILKSTTNISCEVNFASVTCGNTLYIRWYCKNWSHNHSLLLCNSRSQEPFPMLNSDRCRSNIQCHG